MRDNKDKSQKEPDVAVALASVLLNVLILLALCGSAWMLHSIIARPDSGGVLLRDLTLYR